MVKQFKNDFLWGASSSAFQIEGAWNEDGKGLTVADYNSFKKSAVQADTKVASDFYHHFKEDIALMKELGLKTYRFSLSWARIIPTGDGEINQAGIDFYNAVIDTLLENDILPFVTLYHFDYLLHWWKNTMVGRIVAAFPHFNAMRKFVIKRLVIESKIGKLQTNKT